MYYITDTLKIKSITAKKIRGLVDDDFDIFATECGELDPSQARSTEWLCFRTPEMRFGITDNAENDCGTHLLATINAGVSGGEIEDRAAADGLDVDHEDFDSSDIISKIFKENCEEKNVSVVVVGRGSFAFDDAWEKEILELVTEIVRNWRAAEKVGARKQRAG